MQILARSGVKTMSFGKILLLMMKKGVTSFKAVEAVMGRWHKNELISF